MNGGEIVAEVLARHGVQFLFTLCGGHISPILVGCRRRGMRVIDTRHESAAVFAADAVSRLTGTPGVAAVTAGPGVTNTLTALKNAQLAQSPLVLLGGATAGLLKGRGALQDINHLELLRGQVKWAVSVERVRDLPVLLTKAFRKAREGVPGPVFVEIPLDRLYDETLVRDLFEAKGAAGNRLTAWYLRRYLNRIFHRSDHLEFLEPDAPNLTVPSEADLEPVVERFAAAQRPVVVLGSQSVLQPASIPEIVSALERIGAPVFLSGMARGLLGPAHPLQIRHRRKEALRQADLVLLAGVPADFRLNYGRDIPRSAFLVSANLSEQDLHKNRKPDIGLHADPGACLTALGRLIGASPNSPAGWIESLRAGDRERECEIRQSAEERTEWINPVALCQAIDRAMDRRSIIVADGGDFVGTASYIVRPRAPLSWLDPGPFGTLGVGAGFALAAALCRPGHEIWILYGDGSVGFTLAEFDTFVRHGIPVIAVVANDGCWTQIYREQIQILGDDTGCMLARTDYHAVVEGLGGRGLLVRSDEEVDSTLAQAKSFASQGRPVLVNAWIGRTQFRKGSISI